VETLYTAYLLVFIFGTFIGSFLNVLILRHSTGKTLLGRSGCMSCRKQLLWSELVPVLSFIFQGGRCRKCRSVLSLQYPVVELATGAFFLVAFLISESVLEIVFNAFLFSILIIITAYDLRHKIIPDRYVWALVFLGFVSLFVNFALPALVLPSFVQLVSGIVVASPLLLLWFVSRGMWIGFGDSKIALGMGTFLGIQAGLVALMYAFWAGAFYGVSIMLVQKLHTALRLNKGGETLTMKSEVPFAPFLILGFILIYIFKDIFFQPFAYLYF
jgi:prepilin signal peptidase PulO-like enzyme (type II secretory pathway)